MPAEPTPRIEPTIATPEPPKPAASAVPAATPSAASPAAPEPSKGAAEPGATSAQGAEPPKPAAPSAEPPKPPEPAPEQRAVDGLMSEIKRLRQKLADERKAKAAAPAAPPGGALSAEELDARVHAKAEEIAAAKIAQADWDSKMNSIIAQGRQQFTATEFNASVKAIRDMVDSDDPIEVQRYNLFLGAAAESGAAPQIIHALGKDPVRLLEIMAEAPLKMTMTIANLAQELKKPEPLTAADRPITPLASQGIHYEAIKPDDAERGMRLPKAEWFAQREKQAKERGLQ